MLVMLPICFSTGLFIPLWDSPAIVGNDSIAATPVPSSIPYTGVSVNTNRCIYLPGDVGGSVGAGGTYNRSFDVVDGLKRLNVTLNWVAGSLNLTLDSNGTEINSSTAATDPNVDYTENGTFIRYLITNPAIGSCVACISNVSTQTSFDLRIEFIQKHPKTGECFANPCSSCHVTEISYNAPPVAEHITNGTATRASVWTNASCAACHVNDIVIPPGLDGAGVNTSNEGAMTAHYGAHLAFDTSDCIACHEDDDIRAKWGAPTIRGTSQDMRLSERCNALAGSGN